MEKTCENCTQIKLSKNHCIDMTCRRGYVNGDHDGWTDKKIDINSWPNEAVEKDYHYKPFSFRFDSRIHNESQIPQKDPSECKHFGDCIYSRCPCDKWEK